jgi:hypothetical protein
MFLGFLLYDDTYWSISVAKGCLALEYCVLVKYKKRDGS